MSSTGPSDRPRPVLHYVLSSHWDREWYQPFQVYRHRLVRLLDTVTDALKDGALTGPFTCDGQAIVLEDYLDVRPERAELVRSLVATGRLVVGPWYVLPDEWLVSGEAMIRNLERGRRVARALGGIPSDAGFVCDLFGHASQLPQILAGFGIRAALVWRGIDPPAKSCVLRWVGADGTSLPTYRFGRDGYCDFCLRVRCAEDPRVALSRYVDDELARSAMPVGLIFDGADHVEWDHSISALVAEYARDPARRAEIVHSTLDAFCADLIAHADTITNEHRGEMRDAGKSPAELDRAWLIPGVLSSRVWIKQRNDHCTAMLTRLVEPLTLLARLTADFHTPSGFLDLAWKLLLENHPHDSICGCSIDAVHQDVDYRLRQVEQLVARLTGQATARIAAALAPKLVEQQLRVVLFNPSTRSRHEVERLTLDIPVDWPKFNEFFGFEPQPAFRIFRCDGSELEYHRLGQSTARSRLREFSYRFPQPYSVDQVHVATRVELPAMGYTTLIVRPTGSTHPTRHPRHRSMVRGPSIDNGLVTVDALGMQVKGRRISIACEHTSDIGDGWYFGPAVNARTTLTNPTANELSIIHDTPLLATLRVRSTLRVPESFDFRKMTAASRLVELVVESDYTLTDGSSLVRVVTRVFNTAKDHRIRMVLNAAVETDHFESDSAFDVVRRPVGLPVDNHTHRELAVETHPQQSWTAVSDATGGLAVLGVGLKECAVLDQPGRPIALTLYRSTGRTVFTDGEPDGQLLGRTLEFEWAIAPLPGGTIDRAALCELGASMAWGGAVVAQLTAADLQAMQVPPPPNPSQPATAALLQLEGPVVLTSLRSLDADVVELRGFNPSDRPVEWVVGPGIMEFSTAVLTDFEGRRTGSALNLDRGMVRVPVGAKRVVTLRLS